MALSVRRVGRFHLMTETEGSHPRIRVFLDTNVILAAAFGRRSHVKELLANANVEGVTSSAVMDEVYGKLDSAAANEDARRGAGLLVDAFLTEHGIDAADGSTPGAEGDPAHATAASALQCDCICTFDADFSDPTEMPPHAPPATTPLGLLRDLDPQSYMVEAPRLGSAGTLMMMGRRPHAQSRRGDILISENGTCVYADTDGSMVVESVGQSPQRSHTALPPPGYAFVLTIRYRADGRVSLDIWIDNDHTYVPPGATPDHHDRVPLLDASVPFGSRSRIIMSGQFLSEIHGVSGADRWLRNGVVRRAVDAATFDHVRSTSVDDLIERIEVVRSPLGDGLEMIAVTLRSPNERGLFPFTP